METKICKSCNFEKTNDCFTKGKSKCKVCLAKIKREKYQENPEYFKKWAKENPEKVRESLKTWAKLNPDKVRLKRKKYNLKHSEINKEKSRLWREKNPEYKKKYNKENREKLWENEKKRRENILVKLTVNIRNRVKIFLKTKNITKRNKTFDFVGCTPEYLKEHIEKQFTEGMSWDLMGKHIHIDHIIPLSSAKTEEEIYKLCHYTNLQPLWAKDNLSKNNKII